MIKLNINKNKWSYKGILIIFSIILSSVVILNNFNLLDQIDLSNTENDSSNTINDVDKNLPTTSPSEPVNTPVMNNPSEFTYPNADNNINLNPSNNYKLGAISTGFQVDSTMDISQFTDHMMSVVAINDSIRFTVSFTITEQYQYQFDAILYNSSGVTITSASNSNYYSPGTDHVATFDFSGFAIRNSKSIGEFNISLRIIKYNLSSYEILPYQNVHTTGYYDYNWFAIPPTPVSNTFTFQGTDIDSNGLNDILTVSGSLNTPFGGTFSIYFVLMTSTGLNIDSKWIYPSLAQGTNTISTQFAGWNLYLPNNYNGTYTLFIKVNLDNSPGWNLYPFTNISVSQNFNKFSWDFHPISSVSVTSFQPHYDSNSLIDSFMTSFRVNSRLSGYSYYYIYIYENGTNNQVGSYYYYSMSQTSTGDNNFDISIGTLAFSQYGKDTSYYISVDAYFSSNQINDGSQYKRFSQIYTSTTYLASEFESTGATMLNSFTAYGTDTDSDGLFNYISIDVQIQVNKPGQYYLRSGLYENGTNIYLMSDSSGWQIFTSTGIKIITLSFNVWEVFDVKGSAWNNSLQLRYLELNQLDPISSNSVNIYYNSSAVYTFSMNPNLFDPFPAYLTQIYSYNLQNNYGTSAWDTLEFIVEVEVVEPGLYYVCANLDVTGFGNIDNNCGNTVNVVTNGTVALSINFDISLISNFSTNQTLQIGWLSLRSQKYGQLIYNSNSNIFTITGIDPTTIEEPNASIKNIVGTSGIDSDGNSKFNTVIFTVNVSLKISGYVDMWLYANNNVSTCSINGHISSTFSSGLNLINVSFNSYDMICGSLTYDWIVTSVTLNFNGKFVSQLTPNFVTQAFGPTNLDPIPVTQPYGFSGTFINSDTDPGYDYLSVTFKVNATKVGYYYFYINLYTSDTSSSRGSNSTIKILSIGVNTVEIKFYNLVSYQDVNVTYQVGYYNVYGYDNNLKQQTIRYWSAWPYINVGSQVSYTQFDKPAAYFGSYMAFSAWSMNSTDYVTVNNTLYPVINYINFTVTVVVEKNGNYRVDCYIYS